MSILIPVKNEAANLRPLVKLLDGVRQRIADRGWQLQSVVLIEGGSTDNTVAEIEQLSAELPWIQLRQESTVGNLRAAWERGIDSTTSDFFALMDADLCHHPEDILPMLDEASRGADVAICCRFSTPLGVTMPGKAIHRKGVTLATSSIIRHLTGYPGYDPAHGFRLIRRAAYNSIRHQLKAQGNAWLVDMTVAMHFAGFVVIETPGHYGSRRHGKDQLSVGKEGRRFAVLLGRLAVERLTKHRVSTEVPA